jgi:predicted ester cyclase
VALEENLLAAERLIDAWNSHDLKRIRVFFHADFENHQLPLPPVYGLEPYLDHCREWFRAYPDFSITVVTLFGQGELVCLESRAEGTRLGSFFGQPPTGLREVNFALDVLEFEGGLIRRERGYWDFSAATGFAAPMAGGHGDPRSPFAILGPASWTT